MSGDEMFRPRARVIREPQRPRASVVGSDLFTPMFEGKPRTVSPQQFIEEFRRKVGLEPRRPFSNTYFWETGKHYPGLIPLAVYNPGNHWVLVVDINPDSSIEVFDPTAGLRIIGGELRGNGFYYLRREENSTGEYPFSLSSQTSVLQFRSGGYSLHREPLARLGRIQSDPLNCGPLVFYAALVAKGRIKSS